MEAARRTGADAGTSQLPLPLPGACNGLSPSPSSKPVFGEDLYAELNSHVARTSEAATSPVFALEDGLGFISFCVQSIVQDQFTACFQPKPRRWVERWTPDLPIVIGSWIVRYLILFPWRWVVYGRLGELPNVLTLNRKRRLLFVSLEWSLAGSTK